MINKDIFGGDYPGRGIVVGLDETGTKAVFAYFIMGRSENSRNRIFVADGDNIKTKAYDEDKLVDPSLIIYSPVIKRGKVTIITNGDQTDTVNDFLNAGKSFRDALMTRTYEPDSLFTPRISAILDLSGGNIRYEMSILKSSDGNETVTVRNFYSYEGEEAGKGRFIHTYGLETNNGRIPSFAGEPVRVDISGDERAFADELWDTLDNDNKVSLFVRSVEITTGEEQTVIINKHSEDPQKSCGGHCEL